MTTKDQERQAIEKIRKIVEGLGENSYVGFAMEGVLELAKALLDEIENEALFNLLRSADKETLQIVFFRMLDIPTEQIAEKMGLTPNAIYLRINRLKEKIKKLKMGERK